MVPDPSTSVASKNASVAPAIDYFEAVLNMVKGDQLPGPIAPSILSKVVKLSHRSDVSFHELSIFCAQHQALSAKVLAVVNSVYYSRGNAPVTNLDAAVARLGLRQTSAILHAAATRSYVVGKDPKLRAMIAASLETSLMVALAAHALATQSKYRKLEEVYTVGLFHNIGGTFFLYTLGLLQDKGTLGAIDADVVLTVSRKRGPEFNGLVSKHLGLPNEIVSTLLLPPTPSEDTTMIVDFVHRAMWFAEKLLANKRVEDVELDTEGEVLGVAPEAFALLRDKAPEWLQIVEELNG